MSGEIRLKALETSVRSRAFAQAVAEAGRGVTPKGVESDAAVGEEIDSVGCEGSKTAWSEDNADEVCKVRTVDDFVDGAGAHNQGWRHAQVIAALGAVEEEVPGQIQDN